MNTNLFFVLLTLLCTTSCDPVSPPLHPEEEKLIGTWQELGAKILITNSIGEVIDSIDINATYEFNEDFSYMSQNEHWTDATFGTWALDTTTYTILYLYPVNDTLPTAYRKDSWEIMHIPPIMEVGHTFDHIFPDSSIGAIHLKRKFEKVQ